MFAGGLVLGLILGGVAGLLVGANLGVLVVALCVAADREMERPAPDRRRLLCLAARAGCRRPTAVLFPPDSQGHLHPGLADDQPFFSPLERESVAPGPPALPRREPR